jgi:type II secretory pathway component PulF
MAVYEYTAKDEVGEKFSSTYKDVEDVKMLRKDLDKVGYVLLEARQKRGLGRRRRKIKAGEVVNFAYKFAGMYSAGLSILQCLETLEEQITNRTFKYVVEDIRQGVEAGMSLTKAFAKYRDIFSDFFVGMVEAGETGGKLGSTLQISAVYLERQADVKRRINSAFAYPLVVSIMCFVIVTFLLVFFVPVFSKLYRQLNVALPGPTLFLVFLGTVATKYWPVAVVFGAASAIALRWLLNNKQFRRYWDEFKLNMPVFGGLNSMIVSSNFIRAFAVLASVGVPFSRALEVAGLVANNHRMAEISEKLQASIETGQSLASSLKSYKVFPSIISQLAASGEKSGALAEMLEKGADFISKDIERKVHLMLVKLEPTLTVVMGIIVGFILLSVYLPMFDYMAHLQ